ncbi:hypothetical protein HanIR_Chr14g0701141 [Helianthus annuus]|nr:hypothetical protein HanIR_Chr14g0701141 [Helianthus annuus]
MAIFSQEFKRHLLDQLKELQAGATRAALCKTECCHSSFVEQIWGPPRTGNDNRKCVVVYTLANEP